MPTNVTESSTFTPTIQVPNNGEPATQASLLGTFVQGLANRTRYLNDQRIANVALIQELLDLAGSTGLFALSGTSLALNDPVPVAALYNPFAHYSISGGTNITVPFNGFYEVHIKAIVTYSMTTNPWAGKIRGKVGSTVFAVADGKRFSASAADSVPAVGFGLAEITDRTTQSIFFDIELANGGMDVLNPGGTTLSQVMLRCVRKL